MNSVATYLLIYLQVCLLPFKKASFFILLWKSQNANPIINSFSDPGTIRIVGEKQITYLTTWNVVVTIMSLRHVGSRTKYNGLPKIEVNPPSILFSS